VAKNRAVFIDRDNTLIASDGYLADPQAVRLLPYAAEAVARLRAGGYYVVIATNQSGVARGLITEEQLAAVHQRMQDLLQAAGTGVDAIYFCPFLDSDEAVVEKYRRDSDLRKPRPGMLLQAARDLDLDLGQCWMIGDAPRDIEAGRAAGCRTIRIGHVDGTSLELSAPDLRAAADLVLSWRIGGDRSSTGEKTVNVPGPEPKPPTIESLLTQVVDELRTIRREARQSDFSMGKLIGSIAQAFAVCALGWGLYAAMEISERNPGAVNDAVIRLLAASVFQLMALTAFAAARRG
jgi:D-glycero-D-manno-heptose 1,7-bisphosphate phosphatase